MFLRRTHNMSLLRLVYKQRRFLRISLVLFLAGFLLVVIRNPLTVLRIIFQVTDDRQTVNIPGSEISVIRLTEPTISRRPRPTLLDLPFLPRNFVCDDLLDQAGWKFTYSDTYWDHADAYRSALGLNDLLPHATTDEFSWMIQEIARMPGVDTVCETLFDAGDNTFQWLVADDTTVVHSFDRMLNNYSVEMADFMAIEFPESFFLHAGDPLRTVPEFVRRNTANLTCDVVFIGTAAETSDVIIRNIVNLRRTVNPDRHLLVLDTHPDTAERKEAGRAWRSLLERGIVSEYFNCKFREKSAIGKLENGITIGMYN